MQWQRRKEKPFSKRKYVSEHNPSCVIIAFIVIIVGVTRTGAQLPQQDHAAWSYRLAVCR